jgi:ABC-2 type transport system permease protein
MARKELRQLVRDRLTLSMIVGIPSLQLVLFGYAINLDVRNLDTLVVDGANTSLSRKLVRELEATQTFRIVGSASGQAQAIDELQRSEVSAVVLIPPDFDRRLQRGRGAEISILADASNPTTAGAVAAAGQGLAQRIAADLAPLQSGARLSPGDRALLGPKPDVVRAERFRIAVLPFYNPERRTATYIVPGLVGVILTMTMMLMTALAVVRERERGTFEFLIATPVRRSEVMLGKILPYLAVGYVQVSLILLLGWWLFDVPIRGSLVDLGLGALPFIGAMLAMGLVVSAAAATQFQAMQMAFFFFLPSMLLSGFMFPFEAMPRVAQWIGEALPLTHFLRVVRGVLLKGAPLGDLLGAVGGCAVFMGIALALAAASFRKRLG